nr:PREDICTED: uncharacterized protein LOC109031014 [Bemisia tabaci]
MKVFSRVVRILAALLLVIAIVRGAPAPQPSPVANPQLFWPFSLYQPFYSPVVAPRSLVSWPIQPVTLVANPDPRIIPQSIDHSDEKSSHGRIKRDLESDGATTPGVEGAEPKSIQKRQAAYYPMTWPMPIIPSWGPSYSWATQSFATPGGSSSWTLVTV